MTSPAREGETKVQLTELLNKAGIPYTGADCEIAGVTADSRKVGKDFLFAALPGVKADGTAFLQDAKEAGAVAALVPESASDLPDNGLIYVTVADARKALAVIAAAFYGKQPETAVCVTGTNGKTSTANFCRQIWDFLGKKGASVGTLGVLTAEFATYGSLTTPDSVTLHAELKDLADKGYNHLAFEASSHGIEQHRIDGVKIAAAGFTNITRDHLDYHKTMENYLAAKLGLFDRPLSTKTVVLNADIPEYDHIADYCRQRGLKILDYGKKAKALRLISARHETNGQHLELEILGKAYSIHLPLAGTFQAMNALCALGLVLATGEDADACVKALETLKGAPGRLEHVADRKNGAAVYVDYAHTPDALETVLNALRPHTKNRLCVVFGCGGDRDPGKRPQMGAICNALADVVYVTDDNPRSEEPAIIRAAILPACPKGINVGNRALAIEEAVEQLEAGDILVVAGKGHETGQLIKGVMHPFDDREEVRKAVALADTPLWTAEAVAHATNGRAGSDFAITGVSIDSRTVKAGDLYIALIGERLDGHAFAAQALEKGAAGVLVSKLPENIPLEQVILVSDTTKALNDLAVAARSRTSAKIIGVTGSSGKTSTKEMLKIALSSVGRTHTTTGNLNNTVGLPLTLARMPEKTDFAVIEMGINHAGEMAELTALTRPDIAVITMIGTAHHEFFKTPDDTALAKAEIFEGMTDKGIVFLNADNPQFELLQKEAKKAGIEDIRTFGTRAENNVGLIYCAETADETLVTARVEPARYSYTLHMPGKHQVMNSLAVVGVLDALNVDMASALQSLGRLYPTAGRGKRYVLPCAGGEFTLIDDAYNANPESMAAGLEVLGTLAPEKDGRRIAVLGDMLELGDESESLHLGLKKSIEDNHIDLVFAAGIETGKLFDNLPPENQGAKALTSAELADTVAQAVRPGDVVFVKGSFGSKMTLIVEKLKNLNNG